MCWRRRGWRPTAIPPLVLRRGHRQFFDPGISEEDSIGIFGNNRAGDAVAILKMQDNGFSMELAEAEHQEQQKDPAGASGHRSRTASRPGSPRGRAALVLF